MSKRKRKKKKDKVIVSCFIFILLCIIGIILYYCLNGENKLIKKPTRKLRIIDETSNKRPIAVMIDNNIKDSHAGLQDSYINYEIIVEGGLTRIMALYKDKNVDMIGPIRSSRHYFLDYALESDAIYTHFGWSPFAEKDIKALGVENINGLTDDAFWRDKNLKAPHNVFTKIDTIYNYAKNNKNYSTETDDWKLLNYSVKNINLENNEDAVAANNIDIKYSNFVTVNYEYNAENKYYLRSKNNVRHIDKNTGSQLHYKNIIIEKVNNSTLDSYGRQDLDTVGEGDGYYITNGYALPIKWSKASRKSKTIYTYLGGSKIKVNDGNTFIHIVPITTDPKFN